MSLKVTILGCGSSGGVPRPALGWGDCNPRNPKNRMEEYVAWTGKLASTLKGRVEYYVLGDELNGRG